MVSVWHGENQKALYQNLNTRVLERYKGKIFRLSSEKTKNEINQAIYARNLFDDKQPVILCENFLLDKKVDVKYLKSIPKDTNILFWESERLSLEIIAKISKTVKIEEFKLAPLLYQFLDNLYPSSNSALKLLGEFGIEEGKSLLWQISNRFFYLLLAKNGTTFESAVNISRTFLHSNISEWQWRKIESQAAKFYINTIKIFLAASLKADYFIKSGKTDIPQKTLITQMVLKYL